MSVYNNVYTLNMYIFVNLRSNIMFVAVIHIAYSASEADSQMNIIRQ